MLTTIELRWFYRGTIPTEVKDWFGDDLLGEHLPPTSEREDWYLYLRGCDFVGVKLRQGKLEIKWRKAELGVMSFGEKLEGKVEKWAKWICEDPAEESFMLTDVVGDRSWMGVKKERSQRKYESCTMEVTKVSIGDDAWWSLGFEASGENPPAIYTLQSVASEVFKSYRGAGLKTEDSYGYPQWLSVVVG